MALDYIISEPQAVHNHAGTLVWHIFWVKTYRAPIAAIVTEHPHLASVHTHVYENGMISVEAYVYPIEDCVEVWCDIDDKLRDFVRFDRTYGAAINDLQFD